jgi:hypothetical protein
MMGSGSGPSSLSDFLLDQQWWKRLGLSSEAVDRLPWQKARDYQVYIELMCQREERDNAAANA